MPTEYLDGYYAGLQGIDANPHLLWSTSWWLWLAGNIIGHHTMRTQLQFIAFHHPQD